MKLSRMRKRRKSSAATRIQSAFRMRRSRVRLNALRAQRQMILAASKIQAVTRGHRSRVKSRALRSKKKKESAACTTIQAASRGHVSRVKTRVLLMQRQEEIAATDVQAFLRGHRTRVETRKLQAKRRAAATKIKSLILLQKVAPDASHHERERCALIVQRTWRKLRTGRNPKLAQREFIADIQRESASATWASSKAPHTSDRANLLLALEALARGVARCGTRTQSDARRLRKELALGGDDPALEGLLRQRLSGLQTAVTASCTSVYQATEAAQETTGGKALLQSLTVLEAGLLRPSL